MGQTFAVREDSVSKHGSNLQTAEAAMQGQASRFLQAIEPLDGVWQGTSFGSWAELTAAWNEAIAGLNKSLADIKGRVSNAGALYSQYEAEQNAELQGILKSSNFDATKVNI